MVPLDDHETALPLKSDMVTIVLLKELLIWTTPFCPKFF